MPSRKPVFVFEKRWLGADNRCLAPFTSFNEYDTIDGKKEPVWFAGDETRPLLFFAGIWTNGTRVRKAKEGLVTSNVYGFLTCEPNAGQTCAPEGDASDSNLSRGARVVAASTLG